MLEVPEFSALWRFVALICAFSIAWVMELELKLQYVDDYNIGLQTVTKSQMTWALCFPSHF